MSDLQNFFAERRGTQAAQSGTGELGSFLAERRQQEAAQQEGQVRKFIEWANKDNPDIAAERRRLAEATGVPLRIVEKNLDELRAKEAANAYDLVRLSKTSPILYRQMTDPQFTAESVDDIFTLNKLEQAIGGTASYLMGARPDGGIVGDLKGSIYRSAGAFAGAKRAAVDVIEPWARLVQGDQNFFAEMSKNYAAQSKGYDAQAEKVGSKIFGVSSGVQSLGQNLKYLPLALAGPGGGALALGGMVMESFGSSYNKAADKNLPLWQSLGYASADAMVEYWTEKIPMDALIGGIKQGAPLIQILGKQMALEIPGEQVATVLQNANEWATLNPGKSFKDFLAEQPSAMAETLIATIIGTGGNVMVSRALATGIDAVTGDATWRDNLTDTYQEMLNEQLKLAGQSVFRERSPEQFRAHIQTIVSEGEGAQKEVYVDGEVLNQLPQEVLAQLPEAVREQIPIAAAMGEVVAIPMADVLTFAPNTPLEQVISEHARMDPFAESQAEKRLSAEKAQERIKADTERVIQQASDQAQARIDYETVKDDLLAQITAAGQIAAQYRPAVAETYAAGLAHFFVAYGERSGKGTVGLYQAYKDRGFRIVGARTTPGRGGVLNASDISTDARSPLIQARAAYRAFEDAVRGGQQPDLNQYMELRDAVARAENALISELENIPDADFAVEGRTSDGRMLAVNASAQQPGKYQLTRFGADGAPSGDTQYPTKAQAIRDFLTEADPTTLGSATGVFNQSYAQQADGLKQEITQAGGEVQDTLPVDALVSSDRVPTITLQDLVGKKVFPTIADRTGAAAMYTGIDSSELSVAIPLLGGPFYPLRESNADAGVVWANRGKAVTGQKAAKLKEGANYMMVVMGDANMHQSNTTVSNAFFGTLEAYVRDKRISKKNAAALTKLVRESKNSDPKVGQYMAEFPGLESVKALDDYLHRISFEARFRLLELLGNKGAQQLGAPSMQRILDATREPSLAGQRWGDGVLVVEVDQTSPMVNLGEDGTQPHPDFPLGIRGKIVGKLQAPVNYELLWADWLAKARQDAIDRGTPENKINTRRAFELSKPIVEVTQELVDRIGPITQANIDGPRQARLAADFAAGNWRTSDKPVNKGGVSPQEFVDAIQNSAAKETLTPYTLEEVKAGIKDGSMKLYQLGDGQVYFMLKTLPDGRKLLASVVNNEQGARGIGAPAVVLKAIEEGVTDLDCYAVVNPKFPDGFLPSLYAAFGFEKSGEYAFDFKYFREGLTPKERQRALADAVEYWKESTPGFNPAQGMPALVEMKWKGTDAARANITQRYLRDGLAGLLSGRIGANAEGFAALARASAGATGSEATPTNAGGVAGDQGTDRGSSVASRARGTVAGIADLNDNELLNLGLTANDRAAVQRALGRPKPDNAVLNQDTLEQGPRGTFSPSSLEMVLNPNADLSTLWHEMGHFFLEVMADVATQPNAPAQIVADYQAFLKWAGVSSDEWAGFTLDQKRPYHERWAETVEQYIMEGKVPNVELQPLLRRFRSWMLSLYGSIQKFLADKPDAERQPLNEDIRRVLDRMLATDAQIAQAEEVAGMVPEFDATNEAREKLEKRSMRDLRWTRRAYDAAIKRIQKTADTIRKNIKEEVTAQVEQQPIYRAINFLRYGKLVEEGMTNAERKALDSAAGMNVKLDLPALKEMYGDGPAAPWRYLSTGKTGLAASEGVHPDIVADMLGFESGDALVRQILAAEDIKSVIEGMTEQRMLEEHGDLIDERAIQEAANEAVHNEARARSLATELRSQAEMLNARTDTGETNARGAKITTSTLMEAAKLFAANVVARTPLRDLKNRAWQHTAAERRAAKRWQEATAAGKTEEAVKAKQDQVLNNAAARAALDAKAEMGKILEFFKRVTKGNDEKVVERGRDPDVVNAARAILAAYGIETNQTKRAAEYMAILANNDPAMYAALQPYVDGALQLAQPIEALTFEELQSLHDTISQLWYLAKRSRQMEVDGDLIEIEAAADELMSRMEEIGIPDQVPGERGAITNREELGLKLQFAKSILSRVEQWAERLDGKFGGPFLRLVFQPVKDAADRYRSDKVDYRTKFTDLLKAVAPMLPPGSINAPELGYTFGNARDSGTAELLHALLHTGNDSNKRKLLLGRGWAVENADGTLDTSTWDQFIERMIAEGRITKAHYDFAQGVWDLLEEMKPLAQETHRKVFGRYFAEVTANEVVTPFGTYRGGYVPAQTDSRLVKDAKLRELAEGENESMAYAFPASPSGFTKSRVEYNKPLLLDLRALAQHMDKVLLFSHMQGAVTDVRRLLTNRRVSYALDRIDPGAYEGMLIPWLNRAAKQVVETPVVGDRKLSRFLSAARSRAGMALMFANLSNTAQQITGFSLAAVKVKPGLMLSAAAQFTADPKAMRKAVVEASPYMKNRMLNETAAMNDVVEDILVNPTLLERGQAWTNRHAYFLQAAVDNTMSPIIWTAAYNQAIERGEGADGAVRFADGVVRQTQGSTLPEDVSRFETGPGYARLFTQFVSYFNMMANTNATAVKQIVDEMGMKKGAGKLVYIALAGLLAPIWVAEAIAQAFRGGPEDDEGDGYLDDWLAAVFGLGTVRGLVAMVPIVGQAAQLVVNRFNDNPADDKFSLSPAVSLIESAVSSPASVYKAIVDDGNAQKAVRDVAAAATLITGLPVFAAARPIGYLAGAAQDRIDPTGPVDLARGLVTGTASPESRP